MRLAPHDVARGGLVAFVALVALEHPLRADLPAPDHFISEYASGTTHPIAIAAFLAWATAMAAGAALARDRGRPAIAGLLAVAALGAVVAATFATQTVAGELPPGVARTTTGLLHDLGTLAIFAGLLGAALLGLRGATRRYRRGVLACALALVVAPGALVAAGLDWPGIGQRAIVLVGVAWLWLWVSEQAPATRARRTPAPAPG